MRQIFLVLSIISIKIIFAGGLVVPKALIGFRADLEFLKKQKFIFDVLTHPNQPLENEDYLKDTGNYVTGESNYTNYSPVAEFLQSYTVKGSLLQKGEIFSVMKDEHLKEAVGLFNLFYYSKSWEIFYQNVLWARKNVNENMFLYALTVAISHRRDLEGMVLPAVYEINPYYFYLSRDLINARRINEYSLKRTTLDNGNNESSSSLISYTILTNYTNSIDFVNDEPELSYLIEDIGWNSYNYYFHIDYPFWLGGRDFNLYKNRRGELFLYFHQQMIARYRMERLSQNLGEIPQFSWKQSVQSYYNSHMAYYNGIEFSVRNTGFNAMIESDPDLYSAVLSYERRIRDIIDKGYYILSTGEKIDFRVPEAVEFLGNIIQANPDSVDKEFFDYVTILSKILLQKSNMINSDLEFQKYRIPGVLEHFETATRDPMFYRLFERVIQFYKQFKSYLGPYKAQDISLPGVVLNDINITDLITYFDYFDSDITNAAHFLEVPIYREDKTKDSSSIIRKLLGKKSLKTVLNENFRILARQKRLNHRPFVINLNITSDKKQKVIVRLFMAPKLGPHKKPITIEQNRNNFYQIDQFIYDLPAGNVIIERSSRKFYFSVEDPNTYTKLYREVVAALNGSDIFLLNVSQTRCGFPDRLLLPKGWIEGFPMRFFVILSPHNMTNTNEKEFPIADQIKACGIGSRSRYLDELPLGFPFDRPIEDIAIFNATNMLFKDVAIYHIPENMKLLNDLRKKY